MKRNNKLRRLRPMLATLALSLGGCASALQNSSPQVVPPAIPPLPVEARQPATPLMCLPTCSSALTSEREIWRNLRTAPTSPARPASAHTAH